MSASLRSTFNQDFAKAQKAPSLKLAEAAVLGLNILSKLLPSHGIWDLIESTTPRSYESARNFHTTWHPLTMNGVSIEDAKSEECLQGLYDIFADIEPVLTAKADRIPEPGLFSAQTGRAFTANILRRKTAQSGNVVALHDSNPLLALHVAAEVLHDTDLQIDKSHRDVYWIPGTNLHKNMYQYCHKLHHMFPVHFERRDITPEDLQEVRKELIGLEEALLRSKNSFALHTRNAQSISILALLNYVSPFVVTAGNVYATPGCKKVTGMTDFLEAKRRHDEFRAQQIAAWEQGRAP